MHFAPAYEEVHLKREEATGKLVAERPMQEFVSEVLPWHMLGKEGEGKRGLTAAAMSLLLAAFGVRIPALPPESAAGRQFGMVRGSRTLCCMAVAMLWTVVLA